tara:strand:+ start:1377 stop:1982 length:606 start_codon:yes stop_codon:yes gene_type:complete
MIDTVFIILNYMQSLVDSNYLSALVIYFLFCFLFFFLSLPGGLIITLSSGFFFGFYIGFFINIISITLGSLFFTIISKYLLINFFKNFLSKYLNKLKRIMKKSTLEYLILIRIILGTPLIIQNLFISTLEISKFKFIISSLIGFTPYTLIFSYAGDRLSNLMEIKYFSLASFITIEIIIIIIIFVGIIILRIFSKINSINN